MSYTAQYLSHASGFLVVSSGPFPMKVAMAGRGSKVNPSVLTLTSTQPSGYFHVRPTVSGDLVFVFANDKGATNPNPIIVKHNMTEIDVDSSKYWESSNPIPSQYQINKQGRKGSGGADTLFSTGRDVQKYDP